MLLDFETFKALLAQLKTAYSVKGHTYSDIQSDRDYIYYTRESTSREPLSLKDLYHVYKTCDYINTTILRDYITGLKFSPSLAILIASGLYDKNGHRVQGEEDMGAVEMNLEGEATMQEDEVVAEFETAENDEGRFFAALGNILDSKFVKGKSLFKPVSGADLTLASNYLNMGFPPDINDGMERLLANLGSDNQFGKGGLERFVDGMIINHPILGTRIVEFDEEQHFTPARLDSLRMLKEIENFPFLDLYRELCSLSQFLNSFVLPKHRVREKYDDPITDFKAFQAWLESVTPPGKNNGYIAPKPGFPFIGGRIAQRAYYDTLRDVAHLASPNRSKLSPIFRFPKVYVKLILKKEFDQASMSELQSLITKYLQEYYDFKIM